MAFPVFMLRFSLSWKTIPLSFFLTDYSFFYQNVATFLGEVNGTILTYTLTLNDEASPSDNTKNEFGYEKSKK